MKIRPEIKVFEDAEYCNENSVNKCRYLKYDENVCLLYPFIDDIYGEIENGLDNYFDGNNSPACKCDQCKADYLKAKRDEPISNIVIDGYRYDCVKRSVYSHCGNIGAILICNDQERLEFVMKFKQPNQSAISTHEGLFNHVGKVLATGMNVFGDLVHIEIMIAITG